MQPQENTYIHDLKNTLEFDRQCRALEKLFADIEKHLDDVEKKIAKLKMSLE